jgi:hypothetical protein
MAKHTKLPIFAVEDDAVIVIPHADQLDPQRVGEELTRIAETHGGALHAENVVEVARDPTHVLHAHFEWNDTKAAHLHRLSTARQIIRIVRVETGSPPELRRAFFNVHGDDGRSYRTLSEVLNSQSLRDRILEQAERDLTAWQHRYQEFRDLVESALVELRKGRRKTTPGASASPPPA